ncbi:MAG: MSMEG_0569 family flavin-dependent oxidoreductase [Gammaproteobacteria bacterium]|jgi:putative flavoprotein involved in K+ transport
MEKAAQYHEAIVVGGGQAGLSMSYYLTQNQIDHVVLNKGELAESWRHERWDSFCLVTPNWQCQLPGFHYQGDDPDGFMVKDEIIQYLEDYVASFRSPLKNRVTVEEIVYQDGLFKLSTTDGPYNAKKVVIACGSYHYPKIPTMAERVPKDVSQLHAAHYRNAEQLPDGAVFVVGSGQSGCQIAEDLHLAGRQVYLSVGSAPRVTRRYRGKEVVNWLDEMGYYETTIDDHPDGKDARKKTNHYVTGRDGGRDINLRILAQQGMGLLGHLSSIERYYLHFENDLQQNLDSADEAAKRINSDIEQYIVDNNIQAPPDDNIKSTFVPDIQLKLDLRKENITTIIWSTGFHMDFSWIKLPVFEPGGYPDQVRGVTNTEGLYFLGLNWQNTWGSGRFYHVGRDAHYIMEHILQTESSSVVTNDKVSAL